jgi:hypothetical protein
VRKRLWLGAAAAAVAAVAAMGAFTGSSGGTTRASRSATTWQEFGARVNFPLYQPTVTLGFKLALDGPFPCGYGGIETIGAGYTKGTGRKAPVIGLAEAYPGICGNAGESTTVGSADINGVKVRVQVYCYSPGPKCTLKDGFTNGFLLYLHQPGSKRTSIQADSRYVALDDFLKVLRSLTRVVPARAGGPAGTAGGAFRSPTGNLSCYMGDSLVFCQSKKLPHSATMGLDGRFSACNGSSSCIGNPGTNTPTLGYGKRVTVGRFRCLSRQSGVTCTVIRSGKSFLINRDGVSRVGP